MTFFEKLNWFLIGAITATVPFLYLLLKIAAASAK